MSNFLINCIEKMASYSPKNVGNILDEVYDRLSQTNYRVQRGDIEYQNIPPEILKNLDSHVLEKLVSIDLLLIELLREYEKGANPNSLDPFILCNRKMYIQELNSRIKFIQKAIKSKNRDPRSGLRRFHRGVMKMSPQDEIKRPAINTKYKNVVLFLKDFQEMLNEDPEYYVDMESKEMISEIISKLTELSEHQMEMRRKRLEELGEFFSSTRGPQ